MHTKRSVGQLITVIINVIYTCIITLLEYNPTILKSSVAQMVSVLDYIHVSDGPGFDP